MTASTRVCWSALVRSNDTAVGNSTSASASSMSHAHPAGEGGRDAKGKLPAGDVAAQLGDELELEGDAPARRQQHADGAAFAHQSASPFAVKDSRATSSPNNGTIWLVAVVAIWRVASNWATLSCTVPV